MPIPSIPNYTLVRLLGAGAHGSVYYGYHNDTKQECAVKVMNNRKQVSSTEFRQEVALLKRLSHPNIRRLYDVIEDSNNQLFIVLEFCDWELLRESDIGTSHNSFGLNSLRDIFLQICTALSYIHSQGVVHKDVKPSNILVARTGGTGNAGKRVVLSDFGISSYILDDVESTMQGTPLFLAPELLSPEVLSEDMNNSAVDMWAAGVTFYILAFGVSPWGNVTNRQELFSIVLAYAAGNFSIDFPPVDPFLKDFLLKLLDPNPLTRISSPQALKHCWFSEGDCPTYIPDSFESIGDFTQEELDNAVSNITQMAFHTNPQKIKTWNLPELSEAQKTLLLLDSTVQLFNLCNMIMSMSPDDVNTQARRDLDIKVTALLKHARGLNVSPNMDDLMDLFRRWVEVVERDARYGVEESPNVCQLGAKHLKYVLDNVLPVIRHYLDEFSSKLMSCTTGSCEGKCAGTWSSVDASKFRQFFQKSFNTIRSNPMCSKCIRFVCNNNIVLEERPNIPFHTIVLDVGLLTNPWSSSSSSSDDLLEESRISHMVIMPSVAMDVLAEILTMSLRFSPPGSVIRAAIWNDTNDDGKRLRIVCQDFSGGINDATTEGHEGPSKGASLAKCCVITETFLNGTFTYTEDVGYGIIEINVPVPGSHSVYVPIAKESSYLLRFDNMDTETVDFTSTISDTMYSTILSSLR
ncbi:hypothetical protein GEMRC1_006562 [Eukaryota sp. GEM-RC1]